MVWWVSSLKFLHIQLSSRFNFPPPSPYPLPHWYESKNNMEFGKESQMAGISSPQTLLVGLALFLFKALLVCFFGCLWPIFEILAHKCMALATVNESLCKFLCLKVSSYSRWKFDQTKKAFLVRMQKSSLIFGKQHQQHIIILANFT